MRKEEILVKYKTNCTYEREELIENNSSIYGLITILGIIAFLNIGVLFCGVKRHELTAILVGFCATKNFYKYKNFHKKGYLILGGLCAISALIEIILSVLGVK